METTEKKQNFFKRHFKTIATVGIIAIPTIYTSFFLGSMWDPYGKLENLPVAVVNNDRPVLYNNDVINVGERLVEKLEDNDSLAYNFVDEAVAEKGLENGTYYMVITIPENFSENAITVLDDEPQKMVLNYSVNPGTNYIASKMSESAMVKLQKTVEESVVEEYTNTVFEKLDTIGSGMGEAADGAGKLKDGSGKISDGTDTIKENLKTLAESTVTFEEGAATLRDGIRDYTNGVSKVNDGAEKLADGAGSLKDGTGSLSEGAEKLSGGIKTYTEGVASVNDGAEKLADGAGSLKDGTGSLSEGAEKLSGGIKTYTEGVAAVNEGAGQLADGADALKKGTSALESGAGELQNGLKTYTDGVSAADAGVSELFNGSSILSGGLSDLCKGSVALAQGIESYTGGVSSVNGGAQALSAGASQVKSGSESLLGGLNTLADALDSSLSEENTKNINTVQNGLTTLNAGIQELNKTLQASDTDMDLSGLMTVMETSLNGIGSDAVTIGAGLETMKASFTSLMQSEAFKALPAEQQAALAKQMTETMQSMASATADIGTNLTTVSGTLEAADLDTKVNTLNESMSALKTNVAVIADNSDKLLPAAGKTINSLSGGLANVRDALRRRGETAGETGIIQGAEALDSGIAQINSGSAELYAGTSQLVSNSEALNSGINSISSGSSALYAGSDSLKNGLDTLHRGTSQLAANNDALLGGIGSISDGAKALDEGALALRGGTASLYTGTKALSSNSSALTEGAAALDSGAKALDEGALTLKSGAAALYDGTKTLDSNSSTLTEGAAALDSGAKALDSGAGELQNGVNTLKDGTGELVSNNGKLVDGAGELHEGSEKIADGSSKLYDGSVELSDGVNELYDGCETLESSLADGAAEINDTNKNENNAEMFSAPLEIEETILTNPKNNGQAMSAYMMSVGLWVGCLAYCLMFSPDEAIAEKRIGRKSAVHYWMQEMAKVLVIAAVQAVVMVFALSAVLGFEPASGLKTVTVACMASMAFMMLFYFFNILMGKIGSFILLVFMVLQLSGAAGTYPIELSDSFYQKLHPFMPFTYTVNAFRSTIASSLDISGDIKVLCGIFVVFWALNFAAVYIKAEKEDAPSEKFQGKECIR